MTLSCYGLMNAREYSRIDSIALKIKIPSKTYYRALYRTILGVNGNRLRMAPYCLLILYREISRIPIPKLRILKSYVVFVWPN